MVCKRLGTQPTQQPPPKKKKKKKIQNKLIR